MTYQINALLGAGGAAPKYHTIWDTPPVSNAVTNRDASALTIASGFYRTGSATAGWRIAGMRIYVPAGSTFGSGQTVTGYAFRTVGNGLTSATAPVLTTPTASKTFGAITAGQWNTLYFDTPLTMNAAYDNVVWLGYATTLGDYFAAALPIFSPAVQASDGSSVYLAAANEGGVTRTYYRYANGSAGTGTYWCGVDAIWVEP